MKTLLFVNIIVILFLVTVYSQINKDTSNYKWRLISEVSSGITEMYFVDSLYGWIAGSSGKIYATNNGGETWSPQNSGTTNILTSIYFMDENTGFASGYKQTLLRTTNGGDTWTKVEVPGDSGLIFSSLGPGVEDSLYFISNFGEIHCSGDSGLTWSDNYSFNQYGFTYLDYSNSPVCYAAELLPTDFHKSINGGKDWKIIPLDIDNYGYIYFLNDSIGWLGVEMLRSGGALYDSISIYMTLDGGETWNQQFKTEGRYLKNIVFLDNFEGWLSGYCTNSKKRPPGWWSNTKIYYSPDSGKTWIEQYECDSTDTIRDIFFLNKNHGWAVTSQGKILKYVKSIEVSVEESITFESEYVLNQNYPNPFNPSTIISFEIPTQMYVKLIIYDVLGNKVKTLINEIKNNGKYKIEFSGEYLSSGVYYYQLQTDQINIAKKLLLLK